MLIVYHEKRIWAMVFEIFPNVLKYGSTSLTIDFAHGFHNSTHSSISMRELLQMIFETKYNTYSSTIVIPEDKIFLSNLGMLQNNRLRTNPR